MPAEGRMPGKSAVGLFGSSAGLWNAAGAATQGFRALLSALRRGPPPLGWEYRAARRAGEPSMGQIPCREQAGVPMSNGAMSSRRYLGG